jgi:hypothetical protein
MYLRREDSIDVLYPHVGMDLIYLSDSPNWVRQGRYLVVRHSQFGRDKYVIRLMSVFIQMVAAAMNTL